MSAFWSKIRNRIGWLLRRYMPVTWAWLVFGQQALATLAGGGA
ncbi:MAG: hypothetical protein V2J42_05070 [Wenzhouxiangella sp.]|nr:hypothetical protein [Wenzhouxiangella sp.]